MLRIVTGGQTGVDRGALDGALGAGFACGGWCPAGRRAEDGVIPSTYPLRELPAGGYEARTRRNVEDSDGTVVIAFDAPAGGTALTVLHARELRRPLLLIDARRIGPRDAAGAVRDFVRDEGLQVLNIAGPRASENAHGHSYARALVEELAQLLAQYLTGES
ncbi:MAG: putative molybdenum carrier protein [Gammaproteobacteria bacterium]